jgi:hypothetical protein
MIEEQIKTLWKSEGLTFDQIAESFEIEGRSVEVLLTSKSRKARQEARSRIISDITAAETKKHISGWNMG